jgi:hypothetical protein
VPSVPSGSSNKLLCKALKSLKNLLGNKPVGHLPTHCWTFGRFLGGALRTRQHGFAAMSFSDSVAEQLFS